MKFRIEYIGVPIIVLAIGLSSYSYYKTYTAAQEVILAERFSSNIIESSPWPMIVCEAPDKVIVWNKATETFTGYPREIMMGGSIARIVPKDQLYDHVNAFKHATQKLQSGSAEWTTTIDRQVGVQCKDGRVVDAILTVRGIKSGNRTMFIATFQPIMPDIIIPFKAAAGQTDTEKTSIHTLLEKWSAEAEKLNPGWKAPSISDLQVMKENQEQPLPIHHHE